jgi:hypothetical protein
LSLGFNCGGNDILAHGYMYLLSGLAMRFDTCDATQNDIEEFREETSVDTTAHTTGLSERGLDSKSLEQIGVADGDVDGGCGCDDDGRDVNPDSIARPNPSLPTHHDDHDSSIPTDAHPTLTPATMLEVQGVAVDVVVDVVDDAPTIEAPSCGDVASGDGDDGVSPLGQHIDGNESSEFGNAELVSFIASTQPFQGPDPSIRPDGYCFMYDDSLRSYGYNGFLDVDSLDLGGQLPVSGCHAPFEVEEECCDNSHDGDSCERDSEHDESKFAFLDGLSHLMDSQTLEPSAIVDCVAAANRTQLLVLTKQVFDVNPSMWHSFCVEYSVPKSRRQYRKAPTAVIRAFVCGFTRNFILLR